MLYEITLEVDGTIHLTVEAESEEEAVRKARRNAELGEGIPNVDYECVKVTPAGQS